jgi:iron complex outermembrane recepter protein
MNKVRRTLTPPLIACTLVALCFLLHAGVTSAANHLEKQITLNVPEDTSLESALLTWAQNAGMQIMISTESIAHLKAPTVHRTSRADVLLVTLLHGTGLTYTIDGDTIHVVRLRAASHTPSTPASGSVPAERARNKPNDAPSTAPERAGSPEDPPPTPPPPSTQIPADGQIGSLDQIVVTAERVQERLIDVPMSLTVLSASDLANLGATQFSDWATSVPGITFNTVGAGFTQIVIRGMNDGADIGSTVATYIDDVPFGSSTSSGLNLRVSLDPSLLDVQKIEVLKGPQGTLYGASSMGGLISYTTTPPELSRYSARVQTGVSDIQDGGIGYDFSATLNAPLVADELALRASAFENHDGGYIKNMAVARNDANRADTYGALLSVLYAPGAAFDIRLSGFAQNISRDGESTADYTASGAPAYGPLDQFRLIAEPFEQHYRLGSATIHYDFGPVRLTSISSYQSVLTSLVEDYTPYYLALFRALNYPYSAVGFANSPTSTKKFTEEDRLNSRPEGRLTWVLGLFYTHESSSGSGYYVVHDLSGNVVPNSILSTYMPSIYEEYAAYGDITLHITKKLSLTTGIRESHNRQAVSHYSVGLFAGPQTPTTRSAATVPTYLANVAYHILPNASAYLRYATGYRPGGPNSPVVLPTTGQLITPPPYAADRVRDYEAGLKAQSTDASVQAQLSLYYMDWRNIQLLVCSAFCYNGNASGGATLQGVEANISTHPAPPLTISAALGYEHAYLRQAETSLGAAAGAPLPNVPYISASLSTDYALSLQGLRPTVGLSARYVDARRVSFDQSTSFPQYHLPPYATMDAHLSFYFFDDRAQATVYIHNAFNHIAQLSAYTYNGPRPAIAAPRTVGVQISADL